MLHPSPNVILLMRRRLLLLFRPARLSNNPAFQLPRRKKKKKKCARADVARRGPRCRCPEPHRQKKKKIASSDFTLIEAHDSLQLAGGWCYFWKWLTGSTPDPRVKLLAWLFQVRRFWFIFKSWFFTTLSANWQKRNKKNSWIF